jgi:putative addiction module component (TIGR02574 family)
MTRSLDDIDYLHLSVAERLVLIQDILDSVVHEGHAEPLTPRQLAEMERRALAVDIGEERRIPWEQVRASFLRAG